MSESSEQPLTIPIDENSKAFFKGMAAAEGAQAQLDAAAVPSTHDQRAAFFWLTVGVRLAEDYPKATPDVQAQYLAGASTRGLAGPSVVVQIPTLSNDAFGGDDMAENDPESYEVTAREEIARLLRQAARDIHEGYVDEGNLRDVNGNTVGTFRVDLFS